MTLAAVGSFDDWVVRDRKRRDRDQFITLMLSEGRTLEEIGEALGITRERVRQLADRIGVKRTKFVRVAPEVLMVALRDPAVRSIEDVAARCGHNVDAVREGIRSLGIAPAAMRLLRWRRTFPTRQKYAHVIRSEAARLGRTPTQRDLEAALGVKKGAAAPILANTFGSFRRAMLYCDLVPRGVGWAGRVQPHRLATHCRRGHERTNDNTYNYFDKARGAWVRNCRLCARYRESGGPS